MSTVERSGDVSRRSFLRKSAVVAPAAALAASALVKPAQGATSRFPFPDEYPGTNAHNFNSIRKHENDHVDALVQALTASGSSYPAPQFVNLDQTNPTTSPTTRTFSRTRELPPTGAPPR